MSQPDLHHIDCPTAAGQSATFRLAYWQWGEAASAHLVLCVHGLTRQGRDFDALANALVQRARAQGRSLRVVSVDVAGRGHSGWLPEASFYQPVNYLAHLQALLAHLHAQTPVTTFDWVGTSMGGIIGMLAAAQPALWPVPPRRLVLNDIGPVLEWAGLERIRGYAGVVGPFPSLPQALALLRERMVSFGPHTDDGWTALNTPMLRPATGTEFNGPVVLHYDPAIAQPFKHLTPEANAQGGEVMRGVYESIRCETLLLRGAQSELLSRETALAMTQSGPRPQLVEFEGVGHAPTLIADEQVDVVSQFILKA